MLVRILISDTYDVMIKGYGAGIFLHACPALLCCIDVILTRPECKMKMHSNRAKKDH